MYRKQDRILDRRIALPRAEGRRGQRGDRPPNHPRSPSRPLPFGSESQARRRQTWTDGHVNYVMMSAGDVGDSSIMFLIMESGGSEGKEGCQVERLGSYL